MKKYSILAIIGGAAITALSFSLLSLGEDFDGLRYGLLAVGLIAAIVGTIILVVCCRPKKGYQIPQGAEYAKKKSIMTAVEIDFLFLRQNTVDMRRCDILPQIALNAVIDKKNAAYRNELFRVIDFCVVDRVSYEPLLLIELNDKSHLRDDRRLRDEKVAAICAAAKLPLVAFTLADATDQRLVKDKIRKYVKVK